ncbi:MAG: glutaredoxin family protein [Pyrinomonadaceae bacterium]
MINVVIYSRPGCHLCDQAKAAIFSSDCNDQLIVTEVNIEADQKLLKRFEKDIPVIEINGVVAFIHRVSPTEFRERIQWIAGES